MNRKPSILILNLLLMLPAMALADELDEIRGVLAKAIPGEKPDSIAQSAISDMYEVVYGMDVFYITKDGRYVLQGDVIDLQQGGNITESKRAAARLKTLGEIDEATMVVFAPKQVKHTLTVFTDIDCEYCRKFHSEITELNKHGIKVRYLAMPRTGLNTPSYHKAVTVWCSKDRNLALTSAKQENELVPLTCDSPVKQHMEVAKKLGIKGTPTLVLEDGQSIQGFMPVAEMIELLDKA